MLTYPTMNPVLAHLGPISIHWYGVMYLLAFGMAWLFGQWRAKKSQGRWAKAHLDELIFYCIVGVIVGGRLGYMIFYAFSTLLANPLSVIEIWQGGMSFHGGLLGVIASMWLFARRYNKSFFDVSDFTSPLVPLGIAAGRLGNFINGELWGRVTSLPWGMVYPHVDNLPRHPSQLYELLFEGLILFWIIWVFSSKPRPQMAVSGLFALGYGVFRFLLEFYRVPDVQYGYLLFHLTMGQILSLPLIVIGAGLLLLAHKRGSRVPLTSSAT
jgi:phosphatidylglycerol---prolipoprotein diacylglyceryl transferase